MFLYFYISTFCSMTDRLMDKILTESAQQKLELNKGPRKLRFPLNVVDGQTDAHTDRQTDGAGYIRTRGES